jgi:hypothetical protein
LAWAHASESREVWVPCASNINVIEMAAEPNELAGFVALGDAFVRSERIVSLIGSDGWQASS